MSDNNVGNQSTEEVENVLEENSEGNSNYSIEDDDDLEKSIIDNSITETIIEGEPKEGYDPRYIYDDYDSNGQYHYNPYDNKSISKWVDLYFPVDYDILSLPETWWSALYDYEYDYAFCIKNSIDYTESNGYSDESIDECIYKIESGEVSIDEFFSGTIYKGLTLEDLYKLKENNCSLEDITDFILSLGGVKESGIYLNYMDSINNKALNDQDLCQVCSIYDATLNLDLFEDAEVEEVSVESNGRKKIQSRITAVDATGKVATVDVSPSGYSYYVYKNGKRVKENVWFITLGGKVALCCNHGKKCRDGYEYSGTFRPKVGPLGAFIRIIENDQSRVGAQLALWFYLENGRLDINSKITKERVLASCKRYVNASGLTEAQLNTVAYWGLLAYKKAMQMTGNLTYEEFFCTDESLDAQKLITADTPSTDIPKPPVKPPVDPPDEPEPDPGPTPDPGPGPVDGEVWGAYACNTTLTTIIKDVKTDIETNKPLEGVTFRITGDYAETVITDGNGVCQTSNSDTLSAYATWRVTTSDYDVKIGEDSHGNDIKEHRWAYTCSNCGTFEFTSGADDRDEKAEEHCENVDAKNIAEASLSSQVAAYRYSWTTSEIMPRTTAITAELVTGENDSYTTGYHNNPVITKSNTESGYHRDETRVVTVNLTNERVRGTITINKSDIDYLNCRTEGDNNQDFIPQGDASLAGAVYGLYANADIIRPDGKSGDRTGLPTNIRMDYCTGSVDDPSAHKTYTGKNPFGIDAIHTTTPLDVPIQQVSYNYSDNCVYHKGDLVAVGMFDMNLIKGTFQ